MNKLRRGFDGAIREGLFENLKSRFCCQNLPKMHERNTRDTVTLFIA